MDTWRIGIGKNASHFPLDSADNDREYKHTRMGQMEAYDWTSHVSYLDPRVVVSMKKHKSNPRVIKGTEEAQSCEDCQPGIRPQPSYLSYI